MTPRKTALGVTTTAPRGRRRLTAATAPRSDNHLRALLVLAALLVALALGLKLTDHAVASASLPTQLTSYEVHQLEEVRYLLWLDEVYSAGNVLP